MARSDYYEGFKWLKRIHKEYPELRIVVKHHPGNYRIENDMHEMKLMMDKGIEYADNQLCSYDMASKSKLCVSYCSSMVLELNGHYNLAKYIYHSRKGHIKWRQPCIKEVDEHVPPNVPAFFLDPGLRNRHFCRHTDEVADHNCDDCVGNDMEVYKPYRLKNYELLMEEVRRYVL